LGGREQGGLARPQHRAALSVERAVMPADTVVLPADAEALRAAGLRAELPVCLFQEVRQREPRVLLELRRAPAVSLVLSAQDLCREQRAAQQEAAEREVCRELHQQRAAMQWVNRARVA
jgi:hypothetical protein